jgi:hypothetical protein
MIISVPLSIVLSVTLLSIHMLILWNTKLHIVIKMILTCILFYFLYERIRRVKHRAEHQQEREQEQEQECFETSIKLVQETDPKVEQESTVLYELYQKYNKLMDDYRNLRTDCQRTVLDRQEELRNILAEIYKIDPTPIDITAKLDFISSQRTNNNPKPTYNDQMDYDDQIDYDQIYNRNNKKYKHHRSKKIIYENDDDDCEDRYSINL